MKKHNREKTWYVLLTRWQLGWAGLSGHLPLFQLAIMDFQAKLKEATELPSNEELFTQEEIEHRRKYRQGLVSRINPLEQNLSWARRIRSRFGKAEPFEPTAKLPLINEVLTEELFTRKERAARLAAKQKQLRAEFRRAHKHMLELFKRYHALTSSLPADALDDDIRHLGEEYRDLGRLREWFAEYEKLAIEVASISEKQSPDMEYNEDPIRLLQRDFLSTMNAQLDTYRRVKEVRSTVFKRGDTRGIQMISYFKQRAPVSGTFIDPPPEFETLQQFLNSLEYQLSQHSIQSSAIGDAVLPPMTASPDERRQEWQDFTQDGAREYASLKRIAARCEDWRHEVNVFEGARAVQRLENENNHADDDIVKLEQFMRTLTARIEAEIELDIQFQDLMQRLLAQEKYLERVDLILKQLTLARNRKDSADAVVELKQRFVDQTSKLTEDAADIIPLFRKR